MSDFDQIMRDLSDRKFAPVYFLCGEEPYFIDRISNYIQQNVLSEAERGFNQTVLYGKDTNEETIIAEAKRFPMMAERQVVIVKEAQHLRSLDKLVGYLDQPQPSTVLVFAYKKKAPDGRKAFGKKIKKQAVYFESKALWEKDMLHWIERIFNDHGYQTDYKTVSLLFEFLGTDLGRVASEAQKLKNIIPEGTALTPALIEEHIGISKDYNNFELINAVAEMDLQKANKIIQYFAANPKDNPLVVTIATLFNFYRDLFMYHSLKDKSVNHVKDALRVNYYKALELQKAGASIPLRSVSNSISVLREYDMKGKGVQNDSVGHDQLLREMIYRLFALSKR
jgi:DNA polymerase-3 subunit delta